MRSLSHIADKPMTREREMRTLRIMAWQLRLIRRRAVDLCRVANSQCRLS